MKKVIDEGPIGPLRLGRSDQTVEAARRPAVGRGTPLGQGRDLAGEPSSLALGALSEKPHAFEECVRPSEIGVGEDMTIECRWGRKAGGVVEQVGGLTRSEPRIEFVEHRRNTHEAACPAVVEIST